MNEVVGEAHLASQAKSFGAKRENGLGSLVQPEPLEFAHAQLPTDPRTRLQDGDVNIVTLTAQTPRRSEAGDARTDHDHVRSAAAGPLGRP
ncbi:unannotated protein [freshwater metagenome]|uniref:Unannotated protein n=1 Tax=freshwater metagenome TaxID=449393 RepID=A0A6J7K7H2_9ZZZZ